MRALRERRTATTRGLAARRRTTVRTVYLGTSDFAATVLRAARRLAPHRPALVVTRPDRPRGRGRRRRAAAGRRARPARWTSPLDPARATSTTPTARARIAAAEPDALVVCAYGALIREPLLSAHPILNVHPSLLPRWRGAAPDRARDHGRRRGDRRVDHAAGRRRSTPGPVCLGRATEPIRRRRHLRHARPAPGRRSAASCSCGALTTRPPPFVAAGRGRAAHLRREDRAPRTGRSTPRARPAELERVVRALHPAHRRPPRRWPTGRCSA